MSALLRSALRALRLWALLTLLATVAFSGKTVPGWFADLVMAVALSCIGQLAVAGGWYAVRSWRDSRAQLADLLADDLEANRFREGLEAALAVNRQVIIATGETAEMLRSPRWAYPGDGAWRYIDGAWVPPAMSIIDTGPHSVPDEDLIHFFAPPDDNDQRPC